MQLCGQFVNTLVCATDAGRDAKQALADVRLKPAHSLESLTILDMDAIPFCPLEFKKMLDSLPRLLPECAGGHLPHLHALTLAFDNPETNANLSFKTTPDGPGVLEEVKLFNGTSKTSSAMAPRLRTVYTLGVLAPRRSPTTSTPTRASSPTSATSPSTLYFPKNYARMDPALRKGMRTYSRGMASSVQSWRARFLTRPQREPDAWNVGWAGLGRLEMSCSLWQ
ncbi:hypothetical protein V8D89_004600 [Ganoderma adspersum]